MSGSSFRRSSQRITATRVDGPVAGSPREAVEALLERSTAVGAVRYVREREVLGRHLCAFSYEHMTLRLLVPSMFVAVPVADGGWRASHGCLVPRGPAPSSGLPGVGYGWGYDDDGFYGAVRVYRGDAHATAVRLRFTDGTEVEADCDDDLSLFFVPWPNSDPAGQSRFWPVTIELLDGTLVIATQEPERPPPRPGASGTPASRLTTAVDVTAADWLVEKLRTFGELVPSGFDAYVRVFHPASRQGIRVSWKEIAETSGAVAFPTMDLVDFTADDSLHATWPGVFDHAPTVGTLPPELIEPITATLTRHTATADTCWFAAWNGFGNLRDDVQRAPEFRLPHLEYNLLTGPVDAATESVTDGIGVQSPNLWWPDDHAWCVATEIDLNTTYIACSNACRDDILSLPGIEALALKSAT